MFIEDEFMGQFRPGMCSLRTNARMVMLLCLGYSSWRMLQGNHIVLLMCLSSEQHELLANMYLVTERPEIPLFHLANPLQIHVLM